MFDILGYLEEGELESETTTEPETTSEEETSVEEETTTEESTTETGTTETPTTSSYTPMPTTSPSRPTSTETPTTIGRPSPTEASTTSGRPSQIQTPTTGNTKPKPTEKSTTVANKPRPTQAQTAQKVTKESTEEESMEEITEEETIAYTHVKIYGNNYFIVDTTNAEFIPNNCKLISYEINGEEIDMYENKDDSDQLYFYASEDKEMAELNWFSYDIRSEKIEKLTDSKTEFIYVRSTADYDEIISSLQSETGKVSPVSNSYSPKLFVVIGILMLVMVGFISYFISIEVKKLRKNREK